MAASYSKLRTISSEPFLITETEVTLDAAAVTQTANIPHGGPSGEEPAFYHVEPKTNPTGAASASIIVNEVSYDTANDEVDMIFHSSGNDETTATNVAGAVLKVRFFFLNKAPSNRT